MAALNMHLALKGEKRRSKNCKSKKMQRYSTELLVYVTPVTCCINCINCGLCCRDKLIPESVIRNIMYQVLQGLSFMHKHGTSAKWRCSLLTACID